MARQCRRQEEKQRLRPRGRKGRPPCRTDSHGLELFGETEKAAGEATDGNGRKNGTRCDGKCSALQWATQRAEMTDAACCIFQATFPGNPEQSALISPPTYSSTQINQPSQRHRLTSTHLPAHVSSLTSTSYVLMKLILLPQQAHSTSSACTLGFLCLHARFPLPARSSSPACTLGFHSKHTRLPQQAHSFSTAKSTCLPLPERLPPHCQSICLPPTTRSSSTTRTFGFLCQNICLPPTTQSSSTTRTFGFLCQHACLPLPARSAPPVRTLVIRSQPNHTPNRPAPLHPFKQQGQHADAAQHAALAVMVSARQASMRCGGEP